MNDPKVRRVDFSPDEFLAGIAGKLTIEGVGLYWAICSLIYSRGGMIDDDPVWLLRLFARTSARRVRRVLDELVKTGKVTREPGDAIGQKVGKLRANRTETELKLAANRIQTARKHGKLGGRPSSNINDLTKGSGYPPAFGPEKLSLTINTIESLPSLPVQSTTQAQEESGSAEKQAEVVAPAASPSGKEDTIPISSYLLSTKLLKRRA